MPEIVNVQIPRCDGCDGEMSKLESLSDEKKTVWICMNKMCEKPSKKEVRCDNEKRPRHGRG